MDQTKFNAIREGARQRLADRNAAKLSEGLAAADARIDAADDSEMKVFESVDALMAATRKAT